MAVYLPVRPIHRSQKVRIGTQQLVVDTTTYVDISNGKVKRDLQKHSAIGAVVVVGPITGSNQDAVVLTGGVVDQGSSGTDLILGVSAGEVRTRSTGVYAAIAASTSAVTLAAANGTNPRIDLVVVDTASGVVSKVDGTAAATPVAPAVPTGKIALASVLVGTSVTGIVNANITDLRARP